MEGYFHLEQACAATPAAEPGQGLVLELLTPLRLMSRGAALREFDLAALARDLSRRVAALGHYHGGLPWPAPWAQVAEEAAAARATPVRLRWIDAHRYSARQGRRITLGGLVGDVRIEGVGPALGRLLEAGAVVHAGKGTSMGFGQLALACIAPGRKEAR